MAISLKELKKTNTISMSDIKNTINSYQKKENVQPSVSTNVSSTPYEIKEEKTIPTNYVLPTNTLKKDTIQKNYDINTIRNANGLSSIDADENTFNLKEWRENNPDKIRVETRTKEEQIKDQALGFVTTPVNSLVQVGKGVVDFAEGVGDAMLQLGSSKVNPYYWFNPDKLKKHQQTAAELISKDSSQNFIDNTLGYNDVLSTGKTVQETIDENSLVKSDNTLGQVFRSTGSQLPSMMIGGAGVGKAGSVASNIAFATNTYGNAIGEAYEKGADRNTANLYGVTQATIELATEKLYGGLGSALKTGAIDDVLAKKVSEKLGNTLMSKLAQMGIGAVAEGGEEVASDLLNQAVKKLSELNGGQMQQLIDDPNYLDSFVNGVLGSLIISGTQLATNNNVADVEQTNSSKNISNNSTISNENPQNNINTLTNDNTAENSTKYSYLPTANEKSNNLRQSASNYFNNSQETINMINTMDKVVQDKGYNVLFDNTIVNSQGKSVNAQIKTLDNGEIEIRINPNSPRAGEFLLTHEITHAIETDSMKQLVMDYASKNTGFNEALESLKQAYGTNDVSDEVLADISGQLFGNQEFINNLSMQQPSIFKRIYNKIIELANKITGNSKEKLFIEDLKNKWETAYRNTSTEQTISNLNNGTKESIVTDNNKSWVKADRKVIKGTNPDLWAMQVENYINDKIRNNEDVVVYGVDGTPLTITSDTAGKAKFRNTIQQADGTFREMTNEEYIAKLRAESHIDELAQVSKTGNKIVADTKNHPFAKDGFNYRTAYFEDLDGKYYKVTLSIGINGEINTIYNVGRMSETAQKKGSKQLEAQRPSNKNVANVSSIADNIPQSNNVVKSGTLPKYSMQESTNNTQELDNSSFSVNKNGELQDNEGKKVKLETSETGTHGTLMAIHNLSTEKLRGILELGGFPVPSIAITNPDKVNHKQFGEISVLFDKNTINPSDKLNEVYDRDVWSPTFPTIDSEINKENLESVADEIGIKDYYLEDIAERNSNIEDLIYQVKRHDEVVRKFLDNNNIKYDADIDTYKELRNLATDNGLDAYLRKQLSNILGEKGIYNGKEYLTPSGNRRTFWQLHDEYNLSNIVKALVKQDTVGGEETFIDGFGKIQAGFANKFKSIDDIKSYENKLYDSEFSNSVLRNIENSIENKIDKIAELETKYGYLGYGEASNLVYEFAKQKTKNQNTFNKIATKYDVISPELFSVSNLLEDFNNLKSIPTDYFEAKPQRAVDLDEVQAIVIPNTTDANFKQQLQDAGLKYYEYDPNVEGDRQRVINQFDNLKFSQQDNKWQEHLEKNYKASGTRTDMRKNLYPLETAQAENKTVEKLPTVKREIPQDPTKVKTEIRAKGTLPRTTKQQTISKNYDAQKIADTINETIKQSDTLTAKQRSWVETSTQSDVVDGKIKSSDLDIDRITYVVKSNKSSLDSANDKLNNLGYEESVKYVQSQLNSKNASTEDIVLAERLIQEAIKKGDNAIASELIMDTAILGTDLGQRVQALSLINRLTPEGQLKMLQKIVQREQSKGNKGFKDVEITPEMVKMILEAYNQDGTYDQQDLNTRVETVKQEIAAQMKTTTMEKVDAWRYLSMLGNPKTHIRNVVSNVAMMGTIKVKNAMARTGEMLLPTAKRTKTWKKASDVVTNYAKQTAEEMKDIITGEGKYSEKASIESKKQVFKNKVLEKTREFNNKALEMEDWFFSKQAFRSSFQEYLTAQGIKTQQDIDNNPKIIEKAKQYAIEQAEIATFRQYSQLASKISQLEKNSKVAKNAIGAILPFKKTPINVARTGIKYSPLGFIKSVSYDAYQVKKGNMEASQMIDNMAQGLTGTSLTLIGYVLAKSGFLHGAGEDDKEGKYDSYLGTQTYSITIGDQNFALSWLSPIAMPLFIGANTYEMLEEEQEFNMNVVTDMLAKTLDPLSEMSFLSSLDSALSSYDSGASKFMAIGENAVQSYVGQFFPTLMSQLASTLDDKKRTTKASNDTSWKFAEETYRKIAYKIPGLRNTLEASTDIWGNEIEQSDNIITRAFENFISPASRKEDISSKLDTEIKKVYREVGDTGVIPNVPYGYIQYKGEKYNMSASDYTQYKKTYGKIANEYLNKLINNSTYQNASYEEKSDMLSKVYDYASDKAKQEYLKSLNITYTNSSEDNVDVYKEATIKDAIDNNISLKAATYKRNSPEKYAAITIVTDYDTYAKYKEDIDEIKNTYKGTNNTSIRKQKIFEYLNSQKGLSKAEKEILYGLLGGYSVKSYKNDIFNYINNKKGLTKTEKTAIWNYIYK